MSDTATKNLPAPWRPLQTGEAAIALTKDADGTPMPAIVKQTAAGTLRAVQAVVPLSKARGEVYSMMAWDPETRSQVKREIMTAAAYDRCNQVAGVTFIAPETLVEEGGKTVPNPYMHRLDGEVQYVRIRLLGIGRTASGNLTVQDYTVTYNLATYFAQDLLSKWRGKSKDATRSWGQLVATGTKITPDAGKKAYPLPGGVTLIVDLTAKEVINLIGEHINRQKFAERNAATICRRNILKKFIGAGILDPSLKVPVVGWVQEDRDWKQLLKAAASAGQGEMVVDGQVVAVEAENATVEDKDDIDAALAGEADEDMAQPDDLEDQATPGVDVPDGAYEAPPSAEEASAPAQEIDRKLDNARAACKSVFQLVPKGAEVELFSKLRIEAIGDIDEWTNLDDLRDLHVALIAIAPKTPPKTTSAPRSAGKQGRLID